jgi:hypothetical protein
MARRNLQQKNLLLLEARSSKSFPTAHSEQDKKGFFNT